MSDSEIEPAMPTGARMFQIYEDDLAELERVLPWLLDRDYVGCNDVKVRKRWSRAKKILSDVRWNYGPPQECEEIPVDD